MPELPPGPKRALIYWGIIEKAARDGLPTADLWAAIRDAAEDLGFATPGVSASDVSALRRYASSIQHSSTRLDRADGANRLDGRYVSTAPWSRTQGERDALSVWQVRYQHTTITEDGPATEWRTSVFTGAIPRTVAELRAAVGEDAQQLADKYGTDHDSISDLQVLEV